MKYVLSPKYALRGWEKLPYALTEPGKGKVHFLSQPEFQALSLCNGEVDGDGLFLLPAQRNIIRKLAELGVVVPANGERMLPWQAYKLYPCRFIHTAHWSMTGRCNYRCKHCYMSAPQAKYGELTHEQCVSIVEQLAECGVMNASLTGGECLVRKDFMQLVDLLLEKGIRITTVYTNGKLVNERLLDAFLERGIHPEFNMSFDGVGWHDWLRGVDGAEESVLRALRLCRDKGFPTGAEMCLHRGNLGTLRESVRLLASVGVTHLKTNPVSDTELWHKYGEDYSLTAEQLYDAYLTYIPQYYEDGKPLSLMLGGFFFADRDEAGFDIPVERGDGSEAACSQCICGHARSTMYISPDGKLLPCMPLSAVSAQEQFPNVLKVGLRAGLTDSFYMRFIDTRLRDYLEHNPECSACEHRYICGGGCRGGALESSDDLLAPDEYTCKIFKGGYPARIREAALAAEEKYDGKAAGGTV